VHLEDDGRAEGDGLALLGDHRRGGGAVRRELESGDAREHLAEVALHLGEVLRVTDELEQVFVADKIEPRKLAALALEVLAKGLLNLHDGRRERRGTVKNTKEPHRATTMQQEEGRREGSCRNDSGKNGNNDCPCSLSGSTTSFPPPTPHPSGAGLCEGIEEAVECLGEVGQGSRLEDAPGADNLLHEAHEVAVERRKAAALRR